MTSTNQEPIQPEPVQDEPPKLVKKASELPEDDAEPPSIWLTVDPATAAESERLLASGVVPPPGWTITEPSDLSTLPPSDLFTMNEATIDDMIPVDRPLIAPLSSMDVLRAEYENGNHVFVQQIDWLTNKGYKGIRRTRGDGDCFYRSLAFAYVERILNSEDKDLSVMQAISMLDSTVPMLKEVGFEEMVFEDFLDIFKELIKSIVQPEPGRTRLTARGLFDTFNNAEESNSIVVYLRLLTSAQIRLAPDEFDGFLFHAETGESMDARTFCEHFVESVGKEADHVQMTALTRVLKINVNVAYLDGHAHQNGEVNFVTFDNAIGPEEPINLLYRPGHYDILDSKDREDLTLDPLW